MNMNRCGGCENWIPETDYCPRWRISLGRFAEACPQFVQKTVVCALCGRRLRSIDEQS